MTVKELLTILEEVKCPGSGEVYIYHRRDRRVVGGSCEKVVNAKEIYENHGQFMGVELTYDS